MTEHHEIKTYKLKQDGWSNILTGIGTALDKGSYSAVDWQQIDRYTAEALYGSDDIAAKIASVIPDDGIREGVDWILPEGEDAELVKYLESEFDRLSVFKNLHWAWTLSRIYGGSIVYISVDDGREPDQPIDWARVKAVNSLVPLDRWQLYVNSSDLISDIRNPDFGYPVYYNFQSGSTPATDTPAMRIHYSRVLRFDGIKLPTRLFIRNNYWHDSIYGKLYRSVRNYSVGFDSIANLLSDFNQPVFKIQGLAEALAMDNEQLVQKKIESVQLSRSVARAVILDKEDEFSNIGASVGGLSDLLKLTVDRLVGGSGIPHTRLLGESPSGLGATGNSELTDYYDMIKSQQELNLRKPLQYLIDLLGMQKGAVKMPEDLSFSFCSLYQQDEQEKIANRKTQADIDAIYMDRGVYDPYTVSKARFGTGEYSFETSIDNDEMPSIAQQFEPEPDLEAKTETLTDAIEDEVNTIPTKAMAENAARGLELRKEYGRGGTMVGVARATSLKNRERLSRDTIFRMKSYFARHDSYEKETNPPSAGYIAWLLWGGDEGKAWAETRVNQIERLEDGED